MDRPPSKGEPIDADDMNPRKKPKREEDAEPLDSVPEPHSEPSKEKRPHDV